MKRILVAILLAVSVTPASAQIAAAIGKPLPSPDLAAGTVSVRVVAGSPANPVTGTDVTIVVNGTPRQARTDSAGRAIFKDLPAGAKIQAKVTDEDKKEISSDEFEIPADSGVRLMLSTKPWNPGAGAGMSGAPFAGGGAGAMPDPINMSGQPRPEQADAPGTFTVRLTYNDFKDAPPVGVPVTLVGYRSDDSVTFDVKDSDKEGRATFTGLDRTGATSYFAMAQLPRNNAVDRLISTPAVLDPRVGVRLILSSQKRTSTEPPIDELNQLDKQELPVPEGKIRVTLEGAGDPKGIVTLVDAKSHSVLGKATPTIGAPDPSEVMASAQFEAKPDVAAGTVAVQVHGGPGQTNEAISNITVKVMPADDKGVPQGEGVSGVTAQDGYIEIKAPPTDKQLVAVLVINGKPLTSKPFDVAKSGGYLDVEAHWRAEGRPTAELDLVPAPGQAVYAETVMRGQVYRSLPFQPVAGKGTHATIFVYPRILFSFSLTSHIDDQFLAVSGRFDVSNNSWAPYMASPDGMVVPLPKAFKGALVAEMDQADVAVAQGEGFRLIRPIPPGDKTFHGAFSLPVEHGAVHWSLDLPWGAFQSGMEIAQTPGMHVDVPEGVKGQTMTVPQGTFFVLPQISILPRQSMVMTITGLPSEPAWRRWAPRLVGILVVLLMVGGITWALRKRPEAEVDTEREARRAKLLDELVDLEQTGKDEARRQAIVAELEALWDSRAPHA